MAAGLRTLVNAGNGFTEAVTSWLFVQPFADNVTLYTAFTEVMVVFVNGSLIAPVPVDEG